MNHFACLNTFVTVVQKGGFCAAARHLGVAPATVTQQVQILEERIGARLLLRTTRRSTLTEAGQVFFERGVKILEDIREANAIASAYHSTVKGTVRLNISPTLSKDVSALISRYLELHPETSFDLSVTNKMSDLLDDRVDLAIRDEEVPDSSLITRRLAGAEWTPCASPAYVARHGMPAHPEQLSTHNCLVLVHDQRCNEWQFISK